MSRSTCELTSRPDIAPEWVEVIRRIPGYDSIATAPDGYWFDAVEADKYLGFFRDCLTHVEGELGGKPLVLAPWQAAIVANLVGWKRPNGKRRYREAFIYVPRGNGKTTFMAGLALALLIIDCEQAAQMYFAASDAEQAALAYTIACGMIENEDSFADLLKVYRALGARSIVYEEYRSALKVISSEAKGKHGFSPSLYVVDELHALGDLGSDLVDVLQTGTLKRSQPLGILITTADWDRPSICNEKLDAFRAVRDGEVDDPASLPVIFETLEDADWTDEAVWRTANPGWDTMPHMREYMQREFLKAQRQSRLENTFKRLHLNMRTKQSSRWLSMDEWDDCRVEFDEDWLIGRECVAGVDLASKRDLTALVLVGRDEDEGGEFVWAMPYFWVPETTAKQRDVDGRAPSLVAYAQSGFLNLSPGASTNFGQMRAEICRLRDKGVKIREVAFDPYNAGEIQQHLEAEGFTVADVPQNIRRLNEPCKKLEVLLGDRRFRHNGHPVLRWNASAACSWTDANDNVRPDKKRATDSIDGISALVTALARVIVLEPEKPKYYGFARL